MIDDENALPGQQGGSFTWGKVTSYLQNLIVSCSRELDSPKRALKTRPLLNLRIELDPFFIIPEGAPYLKEWKKFEEKANLKKFQIPRELWEEGYKILNALMVNGYNMTYTSSMAKKRSSEDEETWALDKITQPLKTIAEDGKLTVMMGEPGSGKTNNLTALIKEYIESYPQTYAIATNISLKKKMKTLAKEKGAFLRQVRSDLDFVRVYCELYERTMRKILEGMSEEQRAKLDDEDLEELIDEAMPTILLILDELTGVIGKSTRKVSATTAFLEWYLELRKFGMIAIIVIHFEKQIPSNLSDENIIKAKIYAGSKVSIKVNKKKEEEVVAEQFENKEDAFNHSEIWVRKRKNQFRRFMIYDAPNMKKWYFHNDPTTVEFREADPQRFYRTVTGMKGRKKLEAMKRFIIAFTIRDPLDCSQEEWERMSVEEITRMLVERQRPELRNLFPGVLPYRDTKNVEEMQALRNSGFSRGKLGILYGVSDPTIGKILGEV